MTIQAHFVVAYDYKTKKLRIDEDTTQARFSDGQVFVDGEGWTQPESDSTLDQECVRGQEMLEKLLNSNQELNTNQCDNCEGFMPKHKYTSNRGLCDDCCVSIN